MVELILERVLGDGKGRRLRRVVEGRGAGTAAHVRGTVDNRLPCVPANEYNGADTAIALHSIFHF